MHRRCVCADRTFSSSSKNYMPWELYNSAIPPNIAVPLVEYRHRSTEPRASLPEPPFYFFCICWFPISKRPLLFLTILSCRGKGKAQSLNQSSFFLYMLKLYISVVYSQLAVVIQKFWDHICFLVLHSMALPRCNKEFFCLFVISYLSYDDGRRERLLLHTRDVLRKIKTH